MQKNKWQCRIAPTLGGGFAGHPNDVWGTLPYTNPDEPCVFFGMYGMRDLQAYYAHKGEKAILWAGTDIRYFHNGYWLDGKGGWKIKRPHIGLGTHYVENLMEAIVLDDAGINAEIVPSFLGNVDDYPVQENLSKNQYYTSVSGDDFELYGWYEIPDLAKKYPDIEFHLYGNKQDLAPEGRYMGQPILQDNIIVHGRVPQEQMNEEIKTMTGALRLTRFDGASEILIKSILWGQAPVSPYIHYPFIRSSFDESEPANAREELLKVLNKYPWVSN